jgi:hypothetical protein
MPDRSTSLIPIERIEQAILFFRGQKVMLDEVLAELYGVTTKRLNEQVTRNLDRFPEDFMFRLSREELAHLKSQSATSRSWGGRRNLPAFSPNTASSCCRASCGAHGPSR